MVNALIPVTTTVTMKDIPITTNAIILNVVLFFMANGMANNDKALSKTTMADAIIDAIAAGYNGASDGAM